MITRYNPVLKVFKSRIINELWIHRCLWCIPVILFITFRSHVVFKTYRENLVHENWEIWIIQNVCYLISVWCLYVILYRILSVSYTLQPRHINTIPVTRRKSIGTLSYDFKAIPNRVKWHVYKINSNKHHWWIII